MDAGHANCCSLPNTLLPLHPSTHHCWSVAATVHGLLSAHLRPRLTRAASEELLILQDCLRQVNLTNVHDVRIVDSVASPEFSSRLAYHALQLDHRTDPEEVMRFWSLHLPTKVKFFGWLLHHGRLNSRASMFQRNIRTREDSSCEHCAGVLETSDHIFSECSCAAAV